MTSGYKTAAVFAQFAPVPDSVTDCTVSPEVSAVCQLYTNKALDQHLLTAGVRGVICGAEGQPLVTDFSQRKYWSKDGKHEPSLSGENMRFLDCETAKHTKLPQFVHTDGWVSFS